MMKISHAAKQLGINPSTIRFYERKGLIAPQLHRAENGYRQYGTEDIEAIAQIRNYKDAGLELAEIKSLLGNDADDCTHLLELLETQLTKYYGIAQTVQERIKRLEQAKLRCQIQCAPDSKASACCV
jgi:MerR family mercuric resistance operon transcriptional regulator